MKVTKEDVGGREIYSIGELDSFQISVISEALFVYRHHLLIHGTLNRVEDRPWSLFQCAKIEDDINKTFIGGRDESN